MSRDIILIQPNCGKYDLFIRDMPLGLLYISRLLVAEGYRVHILDQRVEKSATFERLGKLLELDPLWVGITTMTGEPIRHALAIGRFIRQRSAVPLVWGGIHPTIMPELTIANDFVDYVVRGKGEFSVLRLTEALLGLRPFEDVPGLTWIEDGVCRDNPEDAENWGEMPMVPYHLVRIEDYMRVGFQGRVFPIMCSRNCPHKCTFCYNSALKLDQRWMPDSLHYIQQHIGHILDTYHPDYLSFIDDDFFVDRERALEILRYLETVKPVDLPIGFRGVRVSDLRQLKDEDWDLLARLNTRHMNIGIESGSDRILKKLKKGMKAEHAVELNRKMAKYPGFIPLYNFFSGVPGETEEDIRLSTQLILQMTAENPRCQISGFHQYTPYPGNALFAEAVAAGFPEPKSLEAWGELRFEDNAANCPWIDGKRRRLLETIYCMIYFVDDKYDMYFANNSLILKIAQPFVSIYKRIARFRLKFHVTAIPVEIIAKNVFYKIFYREG